MKSNLKYIYIYIYTHTHIYEITESLCYTPNTVLCTVLTQ